MQKASMNIHKLDYINQSILYFLVTTVKYNLHIKHYTLQKISSTLTRRLPGGPKGLQSRSPAHHISYMNQWQIHIYKATITADRKRKWKGEGKKGKYRKESNRAKISN